jgi:hypothetical protein
MKKSKCIVISDEQYDFIKNERKSFNFSKFIRSKLDEYMKFLKEYRQFNDKK